MNEFKLTVEAIYADEEQISTTVHVSDAKDNDKIATAMYAIVQRIAYEWIVGGMEEKNCYNLFLQSVREASQRYLEGKND